MVICAWSLTHCLLKQEAERNKNHLDFVLHQKMDMSKEDWSRMEMEWGEDSKYSPPGERDAQLGGPRQDSDQVREKLAKAVSV